MNRYLNSYKSRFRKHLQELLIWFGAGIVALILYGFLILVMGIK